MAKTQRTHPIRNLATALAATAMIGGGAAFAQNDAADPNDAGSADPASAASAQAQADAGLNASFYTDLPANGGEMIGETGADGTTDLGARASDARFAVVDVDGRSLAFPVTRASDGDVRLGVDDPAREGEQDAAFGDVTERLETSTAGDEDLLVAAQPQGEHHVVTHIGSPDELSDADAGGVTDDQVVVAIDDGESEVLDVEGEADTFADLDVTTEQGPTNVLDDQFWDGEPGAAGAMNGAAEDAIDGATDDAIDGAGDATDDAMNGADDAAEDGLDGAGDATDDAIDGVDDATDDAIGGADDATDDATDALDDPFDDEVDDTNEGDDTDDQDDAL